MNKLRQFGKAARYIISLYTTGSLRLKLSLFNGKKRERNGEEDTQRVKAGQSILVKLSGGRIVEARVNHVIRHRDGTKLQVDFGQDETALIELWQVLED